MNPITQKYLDSALIASFFAALAVSALSASSTPNGLSQSSGAKSHADIQNAGRGTDRGTQSKQHLQSGLADSVWPKSRGDLGNTGRSTGKGAVGTLRWKDKIRFGSDAVIGANGLVYVGSDNNTIFVADGATGAIVSRLSPVLGLPPPFDGFSTPALGKDGTVYAGSSRTFYAFDGQTGAVKWQFPAGYALFMAPTIGMDGTVYVGAFDQEVYALDGKTGKKKWGYRTLDHVRATPVLGTDGTVYVTSKDGFLYALNGQTGKLRWKFEATDVNYSSPALAEDGTLYFSSKDARVYAINSRTGKQKWTMKTRRSKLRCI